MPLSNQPADPRCALLVIDMQYDFMPGGQLAVADGDALLPLINRLGARFARVIVTQDWHPAGHISFASSHAQRLPFESITLPYGPQTLWPDHCVQGSHGAQLHADLDLPHAQLILRKGCNAHIDSYSAFLEADRSTPPAGRVFEGARYRHPVRGGPGTGLLRGVVCSGCAQCRFQYVCN